MQSEATVTTLLFTDIEGSTRLWEREPERMRLALAGHDALTRAAVEQHCGTVVKTTGDGVYAAFANPVDGVRAAVQLQLTLVDPIATEGLPLRVRCGLHAGVVERRDNDYLGTAVNRAARIMEVAHGGQVLLSQAVSALVGEQLPPGIALHDLGAVRLRDLASPERVFQVMHPQLRRDFPALRSLESTPNNLPQQVTPFIGRGHELSEVKALLAKTRLLTLLGTGGIGKTRLSLQAAADALDDYPAGVWFVELASLTNPQLVPQAVASVLGVKEEAGRPVNEALMSYVRECRCLVVLDNCEHLVQACADLAKDLLQSGPHFKILASSREPLHTPAETTYYVLPLAVPTAREAATPDTLSRYEAVHLFVDRAAAAQPGFRITQQNAEAVTQICHRLDGIPLALELAAARVRAMSVEKIAERVSDRFRLLTGGSRTALPRQQTLRALIDWSYELLSEPERALLRKLAVFAGGWTLEAAEAVALDEAIDAVEVVDPLTRLVEKSLVLWEVNAGRYRLLETIRSYAQERLTTSGEEERLRSQHLAFFLAFAEKAAPHSGGRDQEVWWSRLAPDRDNFLAAHLWCDRAEGGPELGLRLISALGSYWLGHGLGKLALNMVTTALSRAGVEERSPIRCNALCLAAFLGLQMCRYTEAQGWAEESVAIARELGIERSVAKGLRVLGFVFDTKGERTAAKRVLKQSLTIARQIGDNSLQATTLNGLAEIYRFERNWDAAEPLYEEELKLSRELGDPGQTAVCLSNLSMLWVSRGRWHMAYATLLEVLKIANEVGDKRSAQVALETLAGLAASLNQWDRAARFYGAAQSLTDEVDIGHRAPADRAFLVPLITKAQHALGTAAFAAAEGNGRALAYENAIAEARAWLEERALADW